MEDAIVRWNLRQVADPLRAGLHDEIPRPLHHLCLILQHHHEAHLHRGVNGDLLPDLHEVQGDL